MRRVTGYKSFSEWKRYLRQKKNVIRRKKDRALLLTAIPAMATVLISACGAEAFIPWIGLEVGNLFYVVLAYEVLMSIVMWQIIARPEMDMKNRLLLNILPAEYLLWLHLCRKNYQMAMMSAYIALGVMVMVAIHEFFCRHRVVSENWVRTLACRLGLLMMMVMIIPSVLSVCSQIKGLEQAKMLIANQSVWQTQEMKSMKQRPKMSEDEWNSSSLQRRLDYLKDVLDFALADMGVERRAMLITCRIDPINDHRVYGEYSHADGEVVIDMNHLKGGIYSNLNTVLHEARHIFQYDIVERLDWEDSLILTSDYYRDVREWRAEFKTPFQTDAEYRYRYCEEDAREYADEHDWMYVKIEKN